MTFFTPELFVNVDWIFIIIYKNFSWKYSNMKFLGRVLIKVKVLSVDPTTNLNRDNIVQIILVEEKNDQINSTSFYVPQPQ
jgi:hypothetical protein